LFRFSQFVIVVVDVDNNQSGDFGKNRTADTRQMALIMMMMIKQKARNLKGFNLVGNVLQFPADVLPPFARPRFFVELICSTD